MSLLSPMRRWHAAPAADFMSCPGAPTTAWLPTTLPAPSQGLTLARFRAQLEDIQDTSFTLELNLSTFGPHSRVSLGCVGDKVSFS